MNCLLSGGSGNPEPTGGPSPRPTLCQADGRTKPSRRHGTSQGGLLGPDNSAAVIIILIPFQTFQSTFTPVVRSNRRFFPPYNSGAHLKPHPRLSHQSRAAEHSFLKTNLGPMGPAIRHILTFTYSARKRRRLRRPWPSFGLFPLSIYKYPFLRSSHSILPPLGPFSVLQLLPPLALTNLHHPPAAQVSSVKFHCWPPNDRFLAYGEDPTNPPNSQSNVAHPCHHSIEQYADMQTN